MELEDVLNKIGQEFIQELSLRLESHKASGNLISSLNYTIEDVDNGKELRLMAAEYLTFLDKGRGPGKQPPTDVIKKWILDKGIDYGTKDYELNGLAFVIARSIGLNGTEATNILKDTLKMVMDNNKENLQLGLKAVAIAQMKEMISQFNAKKL